MKASRKKAQQGIALLMVLITLTVIGAMTADFMESSEVYLATTVNARDAVRAEYLARSGANLARLVLSIQPLMGETVNFPFWQYADIAISMFVDPQGGSLLTDMVGIDLSGVEGVGLSLTDNEDLEVKIVDEDSKFNVNWSGDKRKRDQMLQQLAMLVSPLGYDELFERPVDGEPSVEREDVICEIVDWTDPDEERCDLSTSEDRSLYQMLDPPYERKNAPFDSLEELHLVKGIGDDFFSAFVDPDPDDPERRVMTVWGKRKINVNTAPTQVLFPIVCMLATDSSGVTPCLDPTLVMNLGQILMAMQMMRSFLPFAKVRDFIAAIERPEERLFVPLAGMPIARKGLARRFLTTSSTVFSIYATGTVGNVSKRIHLVVDTEGLDMLDPTRSVAASGGKVLYWRME